LTFISGADVRLFSFVEKLEMPRMTIKTDNPAAAVFIAATIVAALYFGREVLLPIALAVLLSFVLAPLVRLLQRVRVPRSAAVILVVLLGFGVISGFAALMFAQVSQLAEHLPEYQSTLSKKIDTFRGATTATGTLQQASRVLESLRKELDRPKSEAAVPLRSSAPEKPIPVEVHQPDPGALETLSALIAPLIHPLATTGIIIIFVIFILVQQQDLRSKLIRIAGSHDLHRTTLAMDEAGQRLSKLFLTQLALNAAFGLVIGVGLWLIGVPSAPLWGLMGAILRFVPYIGAIASAIFPLILATAVDPGWSMTVFTAALFLVVELLVGQLAEPLAYGHSSGLSPVAVVLSATFWTWLWGPVGLILATPLTVCLVVAGKHIERLRFIEILLGDQPALSPSQIAYQRLLAGDPIEATEQARDFLKGGRLADYYEQVLLGGLRLAWVDAQRGMLEQEQLQRIRETAREIVDELESDDDTKASEAMPDQASPRTDAPHAALDQSEVRSDRLLICIPGLGILDEAAAMILAQVLRRRGISATAKEAGTLSVTKLFGLDFQDGSEICVCYVETATPAQQQYALRRLHRTAPASHIMLIMLGEPDQPEEGEAWQLPRYAENIRGPLDTVAERISDIVLLGSARTDTSQLKIAN
jgi:predicted PurR-regulated permease PerM